MSGSVSGQRPIIDAADRLWLETLASACEDSLADEDLRERADPHYAGLREDIAALLARLRADLANEGT